MLSHTLVRTSSLLVVYCGSDARKQPRSSNRSRSAGPPTSEDTGRPAVQPRKSYHSPTHPTQRANSFPEVANLFCRLPLPTFFHQLEAVNLGDLLRLWVRPGTKMSLPWIFTGRGERTRRHRVAALYQPLKPSRRVMRFHGLAGSKRE